MTPGGPLAPSFSAFERHSYACEPPPGMPAGEQRAVRSAFRIGDAAWGIQFHAEVSIAEADH